MPLFSDFHSYIITVRISKTRRYGKNSTSTGQVPVVFHEFYKELMEKFSKHDVVIVTTPLIFAIQNNQQEVIDYFYNLKGIEKEFLCLFYKNKEYCYSKEFSIDKLIEYYTQIRLEKNELSELNTKTPNEMLNFDRLKQFIYTFKYYEESAIKMHHEIITFLNSNSNKDSFFKNKGDKENLLQYFSRIEDITCVKYLVNLGVDTVQSFEEVVQNSNKKSITTTVNSFSIAIKNNYKEVLNCLLRGT